MGGGQWGVMYYKPLEISSFCTPTPEIHSCFYSSQMNTFIRTSLVLKHRQDPVRTLIHKPSAEHPSDFSLSEFSSQPHTWTPKVCRIIAFYRFWAISLPTLGGLGTAFNSQERTPELKSTATSTSPWRCCTRGTSKRLSPGKQKGAGA